MSPGTLVRVRVRFQDQAGTVREYRLTDCAPADLRTLNPWRRFRWYRGQRHYPGRYWAATTSSHLIYESRLELARLLFADFDPAVVRIASQPFLLVASVGGQTRRHVPDFLLHTADGTLTVVDVKPAARLADAKVAEALAWAEEAVTARGWRFEVWSEPPRALLGNIRFLAGYRRAWLFDPHLVTELETVVPDQVSFAEAVTAVGHSWP